MRIALVIIWLCLLNPCEAAERYATNGLPNFGWVNRGMRIARGGQPTTQGFASLYAMGITNIVKLNLGKEAPIFGTTVQSFPINFCEQLFGGKRLQRKLDAAAAAIGPRTYIHCCYGANRTGAVIIKYRLSAAHWGKAEVLRAAIKEADRYGWESSLEGLKSYVKHLKSYP